MKNLKLKLGCLILVSGLCFIFLNGNSQDSRLSKQERKAVKNSEMIRDFQILDTLFKARNFVLEANFLQNQYGDMINVTPVLNFIRVDSSNVVLQTGTNVNSGYNDVGGVTAEGNMVNYKINKNFKNLNYNLRFSVMTNIGPYDVSIQVGQGNSARATITGLTRGKLIYEGRIVSISNSAVFKGRNSY